MKYLVVTGFFLLLFGNLVAYSQPCEQKIGIEIRLFDENEKRIKDASFEFLNLAKGDPLEDLRFVEQEPAAGALGSLYRATFCERKGAEANYEIGSTQQYDYLVSAKGYRPVKHKISICYSRVQCSVRNDSVARNGALTTIVSESAKLVTIKGTVKIASAAYDKKGRLVHSERTISGAPIHLKRSTMVEFFTTSDAEGNYKIAVPAGNYNVYATAAPGCFMCAEYFGNVVGDNDPTVLNIKLLFYGEGRLWGFESSGSKITD